MKIKLIGCASTMNEVRWLGIPKNMDCEYLDFDMHGNPAKLHTKLQEIIDQSQDYDLIILTYSRCSHLLIGLVSPKVPLVFPNTHDCIGLLLGSNERHMSFYNANPAVYYFSQGWLSYGKTPYAEYLEYVKKYGEENAKHLIDAIYGGYKKTVLIITPGMENINSYREKMKNIADFFGWDTEEVEGDLGLLKALIKGEKHPDLIIIPPGVRVSEEHYV
jgi:hypothetical protein